MLFNARTVDETTTGENLSAHPGNRATCGHCGEVFPFSAKDRLKVVECPHCFKQSALDVEGLATLRAKGILYLCLGATSILLGVGFDLITFMLGYPSGFSIFPAGMVMVGVTLMAMGCPLRSIKLSRVEYIAADKLGQSDQP